MNNSHFRIKAWFVVIMLVAALGLAWNVVLGAPPEPGIAVSPGYKLEIAAGDTAVYSHVVTNTGDVTGAITIVPQIPVGWDIAYTTAAYPQGTTMWMPITLARGETLPLTISLTAPFTARSGLYTSTISVTLLSESEPLTTTVVYERTRIRSRYVYLPLVLRNYLPFSNGSFETGLTSWKAIQAPLPVNLVDMVTERPSGTTSPSHGTHAVLLGKTDYACNGVPLGFAAVEQTFVVLPDANLLTFDYIIWSEDASPDQRYDRFEVYLWKASESMSASPAYADGNQINQGLDCGNWHRVPESGWKSGSIDLTAYREMMVTVSFRNYSRYDNWYNTYTYLDNVRIQ